jgi:hypothetical protein
VRRMELVGLVGFAAFTLTSFVVGFRLLAVGWRTGQIPETTIGASFVLGGGLAGLLGLIAARLQVLLGSPLQPLLGVSSLALQAGVTCLALFTWRVFRPRAPWARLLFGACVAGLAASFLGHLALGDFTAPAFAWLGLATRIVVYSWALAETLREYASARRRCAIGLAHPLVANRFLLWGVGLAAVLGIWVYSAASLATGGGTGAAWLVMSTLGFLCAGALWLAFFPPEAYRRRFAPAGGA